MPYIVQSIDCTPGSEYVEFNQGRFLELGQEVGGLGDDIMKAQANLARFAIGQALTEAEQCADNVRVADGGKGHGAPLAKPPRRKRRHEAADTIIIEGRAYSWRAVLDLRRKQLEECKAAQPQHPALFELKDDWWPQAERSAAG